MTDHYAAERRRYLETCTQCGLCAKGCLVLPETEKRDAEPADIQQAVYDFVADGKPDPAAHTKAFACMECFKCTAGMCPEGLNPMLVNELVKGDYLNKGLALAAYGDAAAPDSGHRVMSSLLLSAEDHTRITTPSPVRRAKYVFFPGCNVYFQPQLVVEALDVINALGDDFAFLPGVDHCCGDAGLFAGDIEGGAERASGLLAALAAYQPEAVVLWCPTCQCRFDVSLSPGLDIPFNVISFPQYLAHNLHRLDLAAPQAEPLRVTLHEACKVAYTGLDTDGPRRVLGGLPGVELTEMIRHGRDTVCCGSGAVCWFPEANNRVREARLTEAAATEAQTLVTVCHHCNQSFAAREGDYCFNVVSYVDLVARALGLERPNRYLDYLKWADPDRVMADLDDRMVESPFSRSRVREVVEALFSG